MSDQDTPQVKPAKSPKPPSHLSRVGTDAVRQAFRRDRAAAMEDQLKRRRELADATAGEAAVLVPRDQGYVIIPRHTFDFTAGIDAAQDLVCRANIAQRKAKANKAFMVRVAEKNELTLQSPLLQLALRRDLVAAVARYLCMVPVLEYANVFYSSLAGSELVKSQLYHCDSDEAEQLKLFVVCEEVTSESGPLTFISAADSERVRDRVEYRYNTRLTDEQVREALGGCPQEIALTGPTGTAALIDTSRCFHYGSRFRDHSSRRIVVMLQYVTPLAFLYPTGFRTSARFRHLAPSDADELTMLVLGAA
jgi:hypothetical protein